MIFKSKELQTRKRKKTIEGEEGTLGLLLGHNGVDGIREGLECYTTKTESINPY